jgi:hypothetical protein
MLTAQEQAELAELEAAVEAETAETSDLTRLAELQEKAEGSEEEHDIVPVEDLTVKELKAIAKKNKVKGYGKMSREQLIAAIWDEPQASTMIDEFAEQGYKYLGTNGAKHFFTSPDNKACVLGNNGMEVVGNAFAEKLLKSLKK